MKWIQTHSPVKEGKIFPALSIEMDVRWFKLMQNCTWTVMNVNGFSFVSGVFRCLVRVRKDDAMHCSHKCLQTETMKAIHV